MQKEENIEYFNSRFCLDNDIKKLELILDSYINHTLDLNDINRIMELYHIKMFFDEIDRIPTWTEEKFKRYKELSDNCQKEIPIFFNKITEKNLVDAVLKCYIGYHDDFRFNFYKYKPYKKISRTVILELLEKSKWNPQQILEDKNFVDYFDEELTKFLQSKSYMPSFIISHYLEQHDDNHKIYIPKSFTIEKRTKLVENYLYSENINPKILQLVIDAKHTNELPVTPKFKTLAEKRIQKFWDERNCVDIHEQEISVSFGENYKDSYYEFKDGNIKIEYNTKWIHENIDYPTLLNNFIYVFNFVDLHMLCSLPANKNNLGVFEKMIAVQPKGAYNKGCAFDTTEIYSDMVTRGYVEELRRLNINIEDIIKWFFEVYLVEEFNACGFVCNVPKSTDSLISKCKTIASAFDGILTQFDMYCEDGVVDNNLLKYTTNSAKIKDIPSLVKNKYCYVKSSDLKKEMLLLFSPQLSYLVNYEEKHNSFYELIKAENVSLDEYELNDRTEIEWLIGRKTILIENGFIRLNYQKVLILSMLNDKEVISIQHFKNDIIKEMISTDNLEVKSSLFTEQEYNYFSYILNNSEFGNGKALRNKYIHDTIVNDEEQMKQDYCTLVKMFVILIIKINDDFCLNDEIQKKGDFYEL